MSRAGAHSLRSAATHDRREAGQSLAEFAIVSLLLLLIIFGIVDFGRAIYAQSVVASVAREGARYGVVHADTIGIQGAARNLAIGVDASQLTVSVSYPDSSHVQVTATYVFQPVTPLIANIVGGGITLRSSSVMRRE